MSLEESFATLAKSNVALAESNIKLVESNNRVSESYERMLAGYNALAEAGGTPIIQPVAGASDAKPDKAKPGPKKKQDSAPPPADPPADDGFGEDAPAYTFDDAKAKLMQVKDKNGGDKQAALDIIGKYGYKALPEIGEAHYADIIRDCDAFLAKK